MKTETLGYLVKIAELHSISEAAEELNISPSVLSRHIRNIEQEFGCDLFERVGGSTELTPSGKVFINVAADILYKQHEFEKSWNLPEGTL